MNAPIRNAEAGLAADTASVPRAEAAVLLQGLGMRFAKGATQALDSVCASMPRGQITGLVGPDAAGKTTLMRILAGLMQPTAGTALVLGQRPELCAAAGHIGYMPQRFGLYEDLSVRDNLILHARLRGLEGQARDTLFARLLAFTSLGPFTARLAGRLSGGMKQKLGIACALLGSPQILLLDEPGVGVDPLSRRELWHMVQDLCGGGMSIVWSTAYLEEAERCPHVIMLDSGRVLYQGPPQDLTQRAAGRVFRVTPQDKGPEDNKALLTRWSRMPGVEDALIQGGHVRLVLGQTLEETPPDLRATLLAEGAEPLAPRLEDAYMSALGGISQNASPFGGQHSPEALSVKTSSSDSAPLIEATGLTRHFGDFTAADNISFSVRSGQIFGLLGPNGAGKSTTFRMLCGLLRPSAGHCRVDGVDLLDAGSAARSRLGYMAQKFSLYQDIPVRDNVGIVADLYGITPQQRARIPELMDALDLTPYARQATESLPLGQKQRLALLCATLHNPPVIFLDEPTSGLDPANARVMKDLILAEKARGKTVVITTHNMADAAELCDRVAFIVDGCVKALDTPHALVMRRGATALNYSWVENGREQTASCPLDGSGNDAVLSRLIATGRLATIHSAEPTLNDIFLEVTGRALQ